MTLTKYEHACLVIDEQGQKLVIDPGNFTKSLTDISNVVGIVITHAHQDHCDPETIENILAANPSAKIITIQAVAEQLQGKPIQIVSPGESATVGVFALSFYGGQHAVIHQTIPQATNVGVLVNQQLYYPGDSFTKPDLTVINTLALAINAPWMKIGEAMDFLTELKPKVAFPTHNGFVSSAGEVLNNHLIGTLAQSLGITYRPLAVNQQLEVT